MPASLAGELEHLDLLSLQRSPARRVLVIESNESIEQEPLRARLDSLGVDVELQRVANPQLWVWIEDFGKVHVPHRLLEAVVAWVAERDA